MILLYTDTLNMACQRTGTERQLRFWLSENSGTVLRWALYRESVRGRPFHNSTDARFLVDFDDPYWYAVYGCDRCDAAKCKAAGRFTVCGFRWR